MSYQERSNCLKFSYLFILLLVLQPAFAQTSFSELDDLVVRNQKQLGGDLIAMLYKDGKLVYNKQTNKEFNGKTQIQVGACSQWLTAALAMIFVDEGKISLDDPVAKYIPIFTSYSKRYITIRNCLAHTTGIHAEEPGLKAALANRKYETLEEEVNAFAKKEIERNPGEMYFYSNIGPNIVGRVLEVVSKKAFDRLIADKLLRPLKMRQTTFYIDFSQSFNPASGALSTANDYINFLSMLLNKGMFEGKRILSEASIAEMQKVQTGKAFLKYEPAFASGYGFGYGLGEWILEKDGSGKATALSSPGLYGSFPLVDYCHGYAMLVFGKSLINDQKGEAYLTMKQAVDRQLPSTCQ